MSHFRTMLYGVPVMFFICLILWMSAQVIKYHEEWAIFGLFVFLFFVLSYVAGSIVMAYKEEKKRDYSRFDGRSNDVDGMM
jgi:hypothetical protein